MPALDPPPRFSNTAATNPHGPAHTHKDHPAEEALLQTLPGRRLVSLVLAFRMLNALLVQTYFVPDEYWQSLEVAHAVVFGKGYLTWEWTSAIRGFLHPSVFALLYTALDALGVSRLSPFFTLAPNLLQAVFAAIADIYVFRLAYRLAGRRAAYFSLVCNLISWFNFYTMTRTLSNSMEAVFTVIALYYWPHAHQPSRHAHGLRKSLAAASLAVLLRTTSAVTWAFATLHFALTSSRQAIWQFAKSGLAVGLPLLAASACLDRWFFGYWTLVQWNFFKFNFASNAASFYGTHVWHWYFTSGLPAVLGPFVLMLLPSVVFAVRERSRLGATLRWHLLLCLWTLAFLSLQPHKEFRFLLQLLPVLGCVFGVYLSSLTLRSGVAWCVAMLLASAPIGLYTSLVHQRGPLDAVDVLRNDASAQSVLFLMPCHSTPFYSHARLNVEMRFLECPPPGHGADESAVFYHNPGKWLSSFLDANSPSHIVLFDSLLPEIEPYLHRSAYELMERLFHAHLPQPHTGQQIFIFRKVKRSG